MLDSEGMVVLRPVTVALGVWDRSTKRIVEIGATVRVLEVAASEGIGATGCVNWVEGRAVGSGSMYRCL